jgi:hypothetical protein
MIQDDVELLDLCILAYQLHAQTLLCAPDPYGEQMQQTKRAEGARRYRFLNALQEVLQDRQHPRVQEFAGTHGYDGAGRVGPEVTVAPIPCKYDRISPRFPGFVRPNRDFVNGDDSRDEGWIRYSTPARITNRIGHWETFAYPGNDYPPAGPPVPVASTLNPPQPPPNAPDRLYCFEGPTGDSPGTNKRGIWSLTGFVLARAHPNPPPNPPIPHDLVIAFRGSRSGAARAIRSAMRQIDPNPDWKTNLDNEFVQNSRISGVGRIHRGFAVAVEYMLLTIHACVQKASQDMGEPARSVYVTGHSLGGALATCFASAVVLGQNNRFDSQAQMMQGPQRSAWRNLRLVTFGAPAVGGADFTDIFNSAVGARGYRLRGDPIPTLSKGNLTGHDIFLPGSETFGRAHSPETIRRRLQEHLKSWRNEDTENPWSQGHAIERTVFELQVLGQQNPGNLPYRFRDGLVMYLSAFTEMGSRDDPQNRYRLTRPERDTITSFINRASPPPGAPPDAANVQWTVPNQSGLPVNLSGNLDTIANIREIATQDGMLRMLKHWLALMTVQNGGAIQQQAARVWFEL